MGLDTSFIIIIDDNRYFKDFTDEKQKEEYHHFKECERSFKAKPDINKQQEEKQL